MPLLARPLFVPLLALCLAIPTSLAFAGEAPAASDEPAAAAPEAAAPTQALEPIAEFTLPNLEGGNTSLSDYLGEKVLLINFWATWCTPCMKEMPKLNEMQAELGDQGLQVISISADEARDIAKVKAIVKRFKYDPVVLLDAETKVVAALNKRKDMPYTLVVGKDRMIHHRKKGFTEGDEEKLKAWVMALLAG